MKRVTATAQPYGHGGDYIAADVRRVLLGLCPIPVSVPVRIRSAADVFCPSLLILRAEGRGHDRGLHADRGSRGVV